MRARQRIARRESGSRRRCKHHPFRSGCSIVPLRTNGARAAPGYYSMLQRISHLEHKQAVQNLSNPDTMRLYRQCTNLSRTVLCYAAAQFRNVREHGRGNWDCRDRVAHGADGVGKDEGRTVDGGGRWMVECGEVVGACWRMA